MLNHKLQFVQASTFTNTSHILSYMAPTGSTVPAPSGHSLLPYLSYPTVQTTLPHPDEESIKTEDTIKAHRYSYFSSDLPHGTITTRPAVTIYAMTDAEMSLSPSRAPSSFNSPIVAIALSVALFNLLCGLAFIFHTRSGLREKIKTTFCNILGLNRKLRMTPTEEELIEAKGSLDLQQKKRTSEETQMSDSRLLEQQRDNVSPTPPPSIVSEDNRIVQVNATIPGTHTAIEEGLHAEEVGKTSALVFVLRDCPYAGEEDDRPREYSPQQPDHTVKSEDHHASSNKPENRRTQDSDASHSLQAETDLFSDIATEGSSQTSISRNDHNSDLESEQAMDLSSEDILVEVTQAQTQSMEVKKGILLNWTPRALSPIPEDTETASPMLTRVFPGCQDVQAQVQVPFTVPSLLVTCPSTGALPPIASSFSSTSVDLSDFPNPPFDGREFLERICKF